MIPKELRIPGYDIEVLLGKGGMAAVYKARQQSFGREVALKVLNPSAEDLIEFSRRFSQESSIVARLHHSHIVQVYDVGQHGEYFYISMEYLHGGDLSGKLNEGLRLKEAVKIIQQLADALDFAHRKNIIHRDIKPANVMFREDGAAVLTDFGIAKELESQAELTQAGVVIGTPRYMSPEQIRGDKVDHRADIYSLGIVFYRCLTNYVPFDGKDMLTTAYLQDNEPVPVLPAQVACFQPIINLMLEKSPDARFQRGRDVVEALEALDRTAYQADMTNLDVAAANKLAPPTVTAVSGRHSLGMIIPERADSNMEGTQVRASLGQTVRAEHMTPHDPLQASARYPALGAVPPRKRSRARIVLLSFMFMSVVVFASAHYAGGLEQLYRAEWAVDLRARGEALWLKLKTAQPQTIDAPGDEAVAPALADDSDGSGSDQYSFADEPDLPLAMPADDIVDEAIAEGDVFAVSSLDEDVGQIADADGYSGAGEEGVALADSEVPEEMLLPLEPDNTELIAGLLAEAEVHFSAMRLRKPVDNNAYLKYQQVLELEPENSQALAGIQKIAAAYTSLADRAIKDKNFDRASDFISELRATAPNDPAIETLEDRLMLAIAEQQELDALAAAAKKAEKIDSLLSLARADEEAGRIRSPVGNNALEKYQQVLDLDPDNSLAIDKLIEYGR